MIAKISKSANLTGALKYNTNKMEEGEASVLTVNNIVTKDQYSAEDLAKAFKSRLNKNDRTKLPIVHISLNPDPGDRISDETLTQIATEYLVKMGLGEQPYVVFKHEDIERHHIHIVTTNLDKNGKKINDSNNHYKSKEVSNFLERKYNLKSSNIKKNCASWSPDKIDIDKGRIKYQIGNVVKHLINNYQFGSINEYKALLSVYKIGLQEVKGEANGHAYTGVLYYATDDNGKVISKPFKASSIGKVGNDALATRISSSQKATNQKKTNNLKQQLDAALHVAKSLEDFQNKLSQARIDVVFRKNEQGRIYGVTFVDHNNQMVLNGSKLGKAYSANAIEKRFGAPGITQKTDEKANKINDERVVVSENGNAVPSVGIGGSSEKIKPEPKKKKRKKLKI